ncbi:MAG: hypothetical protein ACP5I4_14845 [Oceanipulchritudo sp.]
MSTTGDGRYRGGQWNSTPDDCMSAFRGKSSRNIYSYRGVRPVRTQF